MRCTRCAGERFAKAGRDRKSRQLYRCTRCGRRLSERSGSAFWGYRFPDEVIALAVRWYLRYRLSYADDWVRVFTPRFIEAARSQRAPLGGRWRVDETYIKVGAR